MTGLDNVTLYVLELFERRVTTVASKQDLSCARRLTERVAFEVGSTLTYSMPSGTLTCRGSPAAKPLTPLVNVVTVSLVPVHFAVAPMAGSSRRTALAPSGSVKFPVRIAVANSFSTPANV